MHTNNEKKTPHLNVDLGRLKLKNPVMTASGTFGYGAEFKDVLDLNQLGAIIVKGLSLRPSAGNPPPRIVETACGMLNAIGLENIGIETFIREKLPFLATLSTPTVINIYGKSAAEYVQLAARVENIPEIAGIEVNISCPNVKSGGIAFGVDPMVAAELIQSIRKATTKHMMVKLSPNVTSISEIAKRIEGAGADSLSLINTITGMAVDLATRRPKLGNITGGLSGPAIKPVALRMVWEVASAVSIPIIGIGGIMTAQDALEFIITGATAVQIGTANFTNPKATMEIAAGIETYLIENRIDNIRNIVGTLQT